MVQREKSGAGVGCVMMLVGIGLVAGVAIAAWMWIDGPRQENEALQFEQVAPPRPVEQNEPPPPVVDHNLPCATTASNPFIDPKRMPCQLSPEYTIPTTKSKSKPVSGQAARSSMELPLPTGLPPNPPRDNANRNLPESVRSNAGFGINLL